MKTRIIITSIDNISEPLFYVQHVIRGGMVSGNNDCYCSLTKFNDGVHVSCEKTKSGFSFRLWEKMNIEWTLCSERMPPDEIEFIVNVDGILYWAFAVGPCLRRNIKAHIKTAKWTEYTKEKWEFLNK